MEIIVTATRNAAITLSDNPDFGPIETGKRADFLILGADPLLGTGNLQTIETVVVGGKVYNHQSLLE